MVLLDIDVASGKLAAIANESPGIAVTTYLPPDVQNGLDAARRAAELKSHRLRVEVDGTPYRILRAWPGGFAVEASDAPHLRGLVDLYDGTRHLSQCLIVAASDEGGEWHFDYKRMTEATDSQPADFVRNPDAPAGLLENRRD